MKNILKRIAVSFLALALLVSGMPFTAFASTEAPAAEIESFTFDSITHVKETGGRFEETEDGKGTWYRYFIENDDYTVKFKGDPTEYRPYGDYGDVFEGDFYGFTYKGVRYEIDYIESQMQEIEYKLKQ